MGKMTQRVQVELNDLKGLSTRIQQQSVFRSLNTPGGLPPPSPPSTPTTVTAPTKDGAGTGGGWKGEEGSGKKQMGWEREKERAAQSKEGDEYQARLAAFRCLSTVYMYIYLCVYICI